jgi:hypothetical protein
MQDKQLACKYPFEWSKQMLRIAFVDERTIVPQRSLREPGMEC